MKKYLPEDLKLVSEWHPSKNIDLKPEDFTTGSNKKVWWKCPRAEDHEWKATIASRSGGRGCPFCVGKKVSKSNNLLTINPTLASQWHQSKNKDLKPEDFTTGSNKKVWWKCPRAEDHEWEATIGNRSVGSGCPFCSGSGTSEPEIRILCELRYLIGSDNIVWRSKIKGKEIDIFLPKLDIGIEYDGSHWHKDKMHSDLEKNEFFQKNGIEIIRVREHPLKVISKNDIMVSPKSLNKDDLNALISKIKAGLKPSLKINFDAYISNSDFLNEAEFTRFISLLPAPPPEYSIRGTHPEISKQWHYKKNSPLKPENFTKGNNKKFWWKCPKSEDHEWQATIASRSGLESGCPFCAGQRASKSSNLRALNPKLASQWHQSKNKDLKPEGFTTGSSRKKIWWQCPKGEDHEWKATINDRNRGNGCPFCAGRKVGKSNNLLARNPTLASEWHPTKNGDLRPENYLSRSHIKVWWQCLKGEDHEWQTTIDNRSGGSGCPFCAGQKVSKSNNLLASNPKVASEWHPSKNGDLRPENYPSGAHKRVWWQCPKGDDHEWEAFIYSRNHGKGCPFCAGRKASKSNNLLARNSTLASQWHQSKNKGLKPEDFTTGSRKKVWWQCPEVINHEWETAIKSRSRGTGCPFCAGRKNSK